MLVLGIDTATLVCSVALAREGSIVGEYSLNIKKTHSQRLMPLIAGLLNDADLNKEDISGIAVASGPGSFTGIRIGMATARALAQGLKVPLVGVPTLDILAAQFPFTDGLICPVLDARRQEVYTSVYRCPLGKLHRITDYMAVPLEELFDFLNQNTVGKVIFSGDALDKYAGLIKETLGERVSWAPSSLKINRGALAAELGLDIIKKGNHYDNYKNLQPLYLRRSEAEVKWEERQKRGCSK